MREPSSSGSAAGPLVSPFLKFVKMTKCFESAVTTRRAVIAQLKWLLEETRNQKVVSSNPRTGYSSRLFA